MTFVDRASNHTDECDWHFDQYPCDCTCGASRRAEIDATAAEWGQPVPMGDGRLKPALRRRDLYLFWLLIAGTVALFWSIP